MEKIIELRKQILLEMDSYVWNKIGDEDIIDYWLMYGLPNQTSYEDCTYYASNETTWLTMVKAFSKCLKMAGILKDEEEI